MKFSVCLLCFRVCAFVPCGRRISCVMFHVACCLSTRFPGFCWAWTQSLFLFELCPGEFGAMPPDSGTGRVKIPILTPSFSPGLSRPKARDS